MEHNRRDYCFVLLFTRAKDQSAINYINKSNTCCYVLVPVQCIQSRKYVWLYTLEIKFVWVKSYAITINLGFNSQKKNNAALVNVISVTKNIKKRFVKHLLIRNVKCSDTFCSVVKNILHSKYSFL